MIKLGKGCELNLEKLIATRMLINANSGGGKSFAIRRLLEQTSGKVQQIIIDLEGEFITLREKYDYLLVGKDGEIPVNIRTAELLARRLLELNVSTIVDLSELEKHQRITFVKRFLDSLIDSPQSLWHPCLIIVDEAHHFAPEGAKSESASSIIDLMTRGRKRGFCGILATQRISKLSKDAIAEANNCLIGRASLDIDQKRASETLGFTTKDNMRSLRDLNEGEFYAFGSAFNHKGVEKIKVGGVETTHPDRTKGIEIKGASKTPENIKKLLKDIVNLPKEAEEELKTVEDLKRAVRDLKYKLTVAEKSRPQVEIKKDEKSIERAREQGFKEAEIQYSKNIDFYKKESSYLKKENDNLINLMKSVGNFVEKALNIPKRADLPSPTNPKYIPSHIKQSPRIEVKPNLQRIRNESVTLDTDVSLNLCARRIYSLLFENSERDFTRSQIAILTGYSIRSSGFINALSQLNVNNLIKKNGDRFTIGESIPDLARENIGAFSKDIFINKLHKCPRDIFKYLLDNPEQEFSKEEIAENTGYSLTSSGFINSLSKLNVLELIQRNGNSIKLNPDLLEI